MLAILVSYFVAYVLSCLITRFFICAYVPMEKSTMPAMTSPVVKLWLTLHLTLVVFWTLAHMLSLTLVKFILLLPAYTMSAMPSTFGLTYVKLSPVQPAYSLTLVNFFVNHAANRLPTRHAPRATRTRGSPGWGWKSTEHETENLIETKNFPQ